MVHQRPWAKRTRCVVGDNRRRNIDSYDSSGSVRQWPRNIPILESILFKSLIKKLMIIFFAITLITLVVAINYPKE